MRNKILGILVIIGSLTALLLIVTPSSNLSDTSIAARKAKKQESPQSTAITSIVSANTSESHSDPWATKKGKRSDKRASIMGDMPDEIKEEIRTDVNQGGRRIGFAINLPKDA